MYRFLLQGRWIALTLLLVLVVPLSVVAADWQWNRWQSRKAVNALVLAGSEGSAAAVGALAQPGVPLAQDLEWRQATATGRYLPDLTRLVRRQVVNGEGGFIVYTPLQSDDGSVLIVERGFLPLPPSGTAAAAPAPPPGVVTVLGRLRRLPDSDLQVQPSDIPANQVNRIDPAAIGVSAGRPVYLPVLELTGSNPADSPALTPLPAPQLDEGPHLSYVGQWGLIGLASIVVWVIMVRREAQHQRRLRDESAHGGTQVTTPN